MAIVMMICAIALTVVGVGFSSAVGISIQKNDEPAAWLGLVVSVLLLATALALTYIAGAAA